MKNTEKIWNDFKNSNKIIDEDGCKKEFFFLGYSSAIAEIKAIEPSKMANPPFLELKELNEYVEFLEEKYGK